VRLFAKLFALALCCYFAGLWIFYSKDEGEMESARGARIISNRNGPQHPLDQKGAFQIESTLSFVSQLDSSKSCRTFALQLNSDPENRHSKSLWSVILARWSQLDPEEMLAFLEDEMKAGRATQMEGLAWQAWGASDPKAAFAQVHRIGGKLPKELFKGIAQVDPDLGIELAFQASDAGSLLEVVLETGSQFSNETLERLKRLSDLSAITWDLNRVLQRHGTNGDPAHDLKVFRTHRNHFGRSSPFFDKLTKKAPLEAVALLEQEPSSQDRANSTVAVAKNWALSDPDASIGWARQLESPQIRTNSLVAIASVIGGENPMRGLALIEEAGWAKAHVFLNIKPVSEGKLQRGSTSFANNLHTLKVASSIFQSLAASDPSAARQFLNEQVPLKHRPHFQTLINE